eukprot:UC1_evm1s1784
MSTTKVFGDGTVPTSGPICMGWAGNWAGGGSGGGGSSSSSSSSDSDSTVNFGRGSMALDPNLKEQTYRVRIGPDYARNKRKAPSAPPLFQPVCLDIFSAPDSKPVGVMERIQLPALTPADAEVVHGVPPYFVVNALLPDYEAPNPIWGNGTGDGPGFAMVLLFLRTPETVRQLRDLDNATPAVRLLVDYMARYTQDKDMETRPKIIGSILNLDEVDLPSLVKGVARRFDMKPALTRPEHYMYKNEAVFELDIDIHLFNYVLRSSWARMRSQTQTYAVALGIVIEGRANHELPETMLGTCCLNRPQLVGAPRLDLSDIAVPNDPYSETVHIADILPGLYPQPKGRTPLMTILTRPNSSPSQQELILPPRDEKQLEKEKENEEEEKEEEKEEKRLGDGGGEGGGSGGVQQGDDILAAAERERRAIEEALAAAVSQLEAEVKAETEKKKKQAHNKTQKIEDTKTEAATDSSAKSIPAVVGNGATQAATPANSANTVVSPPLVTAETASSKEATSATTLPSTSAAADCGGAGAEKVASTLASTVGGDCGDRQPNISSGVGVSGNSGTASSSSTVTKTQTPIRKPVILKPLRSADVSWNAFAQGPLSFPARRATPPHAPLPRFLWRPLPVSPSGESNTNPATAASDGGGGGSIWASGEEAWQSAAAATVATPTNASTNGKGAMRRDRRRRPPSFSERILEVEKEEDSSTTVPEKDKEEEKKVTTAVRMER